MNVSHFGHRSKLSSPRQWVLLAMAGLLASGAFQRSAYSATLQDLLDGGLIGIGNQIEFFDWQVFSLDSTSALPDLSQIEVHALTDDPANPGLQFVANGQWSISGINAMDLVLRFGVQALGTSNTLTSHSLSMTGVSFGGSGGIALISDELNSGHGAALGAAVVIANNEDDVFQLEHTSAFLPQSEIFVTTNLFVQGLSTSDTISLSSFAQRFSQTGPPALPGDYNLNGAVDAADYTAWRDSVGAAAGTLPNDIDGGVIGQAQFNTWKARFGLMSGSGAIALEQVAVPEPAGLVLILIAAAGCIRLRFSRDLLGRG